MDKLIEMIRELEIPCPYYLTADAYYGNRKIILPLLNDGNHLICRARSNAVAYETAEMDQQPKRGRKKKYGRRIVVQSLFSSEWKDAVEIESPVYGEKNVMLTVICKDLIWKCCGRKVRFVLVNHPKRGKIVLFTTDTNLEPVKVIEIYGMRFKIEVSFKQAVWTIGTYAYHFWMKDMVPNRKKKGNQHLHMKSKKYRDAVKRKMRAYHVHIQMGVIAQGILILISVTSTKSVWRLFGSWIRTIRPGLCPTEKVTSVSMRNGLPEFLSSQTNDNTLQKFIVDCIDLTRTEGQLLVS